jgi:hypothetical protein
MRRGNCTKTNIRCPLAAAHATEKNVYLLRDERGALFCPVHGTQPSSTERPSWI